MDYFSMLPGDTISTILSFLSAKDAVRTCILSKRWIHSWPLLPVLKINIIDFVNNSHDLSNQQLREAEPKLADFLNRVLQKLKSTKLENFEYSNCLINSTVSLRFLDRISVLKPREVYILLGRRDRKLDMSDSFFCCPSIEIMKFSVYSHDFSMVAPTRIQLDKLRKGHFKGMSLDDDHGFLSKLCQGCPKLESLVLEVCALDISLLSSETLTELTITQSAQLRMTKISCQSLTSLIIMDCYRAMGFELHNTQSIHYAKFWIHLEEDDTDWNLLSSLSNVSHLSLGLWGPKFKVKLEREIIECTTFINLKELEIAYWGVNVDLYLVAGFLMCSPTLEDLTLRRCEKPDDIYGDEDLEAIEVPKDELQVQKDILKKVRIIGFEGHQFVEELIKKLHIYVRNIGEVIVDLN